MEVLKYCIFFFLLLTKKGTLSLVSGSDSFDCNFDDGICNWMQVSEDDFDWILRSERIPANNNPTGPTSDHTSGEGQYALIDSNEQRKKKKAKLISPEKASGQYCLSLWYYMFGRDVGRFRITQIEERNKNNIFEISGSQPEKWILKQMEIDTSEAFQIVIEGRVKDATYHDLGDIAIDDIVMFPSETCPKECVNPIPEFGFANLEKINIGSVVIIRCENGYIISGNPSIVCHANGNWSGYPVCNPMDCGEPTLESDIIVNISEGTTYNKTITLACDLGFTLIGSSSITCQADGEWTAQPRCTINNCGEPHLGSDIVVNISEGTTYNKTITLACDVGFTLIGSSSITCQADGEWTAQPSCVINNCTDPSPESGYANSTHFWHGSVIKVTCSLGYKIKGSSLIFCQPNSTWSDSPSCELIDCGALLITDGMIVEYRNGTTYNNLAMVSCKHGYTFVGNSYLTCQADGSWTELPKCIVENLETSSLLAVYVTVPVIVIGFAFILLLFLCRKRLACLSHDQHGQQKAEINRAFQYPNEMYNNHAFDGLSPTSKTTAGDLVQPEGDDYANINDDMNEDQKHLYNNTSTAGRNILKDTEHLYDHMNMTSKQTLDNTYSHISSTAAENGFNSNYDYGEISHSGDVNLFTHADANDNYNVLSRNNHIGNIQQGYQSKPNEETEYDHAQSGVSDATLHEQDEYSHLNETKIRRGNAEKVSVNLKESQYEYASETVPNAETSSHNKRKADYESPVGHTPQYLTFEKENEENDRHYFTLKQEEKCRESQVAINHDYFVLEKIETV